MANIEISYLPSHALTTYMETLIKAIQERSPDANSREVAALALKQSGLVAGAIGSVLKSLHLDLDSYAAELAQAEDLVCAAFYQNPAEENTQQATLGAMRTVFGLIVGADGNWAWMN